MSRARDISDGKFANDLTVDTNTLHVDATNNRVGVNTATPSTNLDITGTGGQVTVDANGHITSKQSLDTITAGGRITGTTNRGTVGQIGIEQTAAGADGGYIRFSTCDSGSTNPTERMRLLSGGGLTFNGDTAAANALDDYEEGTFTPSYTSGISSASYSIQTGRYTKVGNRVFFEFELDGNSITGSSSHLLIGGLPFTSKNAVPTSGALISYTGGVSNNIHVTGVIFNNDTVIGVYKFQDGGSVAGNTMALNGGWRWFGHYDVN